MKTVLVTGGIGAGKSAVCGYLASRGVPVYDSDARTKDLYDRKPLLVAAMEVSLGVPLFGPGRRLDRQALSRIIFSDPEALEIVESIVHPAVFEDFTEWRTAQGHFPWQGYGPVPFVVMESAVALSKPLFRDAADKVVLVEASEALRVARASARKGMSADAIRSRMARQAFNASDADAVIVNDGSLDALHASADRVFSRLFAAPPRRYSPSPSSEPSVY